MWKPFIEKMKRQSESERLEQAEKYILQLRETVAWLEKRIEKLEKKENDK